MAREMKKPEQPGLDKLVAAISEAAQTARTVLTGMLVVALTLTATMIAATDEALFRDAAEVFPALGVKIRLSTAFTLAPPVFAFLHINAMLQLHLLAGRLRALEAAMQANALPACDRAEWRRLIHGFAFAQLLASEPGARHLPHRILLAVVSWFSVAAVPVLLLLATQFAFLRYQSDTITFVHQATLAVDMAVLLWFHAETWRTMVPWRWAAAVWSALTMAATVTLAWISWTQAVPPSVELEADEVRWQDWNEGADVLNRLWQSALWPTLQNHAVLPDRLYAVTGWAWTRRYLDLAGQTLINAEAKPDLLRPFDLSDTDRTEAQRKMVAVAFPGRKLRFALMTHTHIFSANLNDIDARKADFSNAKMQGSHMFGANLEQASIKDADFSNADLTYAKLSGTLIYSAQFINADLSYATLHGAHIVNTKFNKANMTHAEFNGARLIDTELRNANLTEALFHGAFIANSTFESSELDDADIYGSIISNVSINGARGNIQNCDYAITDKIIENNEDKDFTHTTVNMTKYNYTTGQKITIGHHNKEHVSCYNTPTLQQNSKPQVSKFTKSFSKIACRDIFTYNSIITHLNNGGKPLTPQYYHAIIEKLTQPLSTWCPKLLSVKPRILKKLRPVDPELVE